jgi:RND family efflux transporter MFP subunit
LRRQPLSSSGYQACTGYDHQISVTRRTLHSRCALCPLAILCAVVLVAVSGCGKKIETSAEREKTAGQPVAELMAQTITVQPQSWPTIVRCQGTLYADEDSAIGARVAGRVAKVHVDLGDVVKAGDPLVTLESDEFELLVSQVEAQLNQARSAVGLTGCEVNDTLDPEKSPPVRQARAVWNETQASLERATSLKKQGAISQGEYDVVASAERVAEARYAAALNAVREKLAMIGVKRVELALAQQRLADAVIRAPFAGRILNRRATPGGYISAGDAVVTLVRTNPIWFRGTLPERYASQLRTGSQIDIRISSLQSPLLAEVTRISPTLDLLSRSLSFEAKLDNADQQIRAGLFATAEVVLNPEAESIVVPESAVHSFAGSEKVWKVIDGIAQQLEIATGIRRDGNVEITEGLTVGDTILTDASIGRVAKILEASSQASIASGIPTEVPHGRDSKQVNTLAGVALP